MFLFFVINALQFGSTNTVDVYNTIIMGPYRNVYGYKSLMSKISVFNILYPSFEISSKITSSISMGLTSFY
jgi:hypothetical protein